MSNIQHSSESAEHYTPVRIVDPSRELMGGIDLDPASNGAANKYIRAIKFYTKRRSGLTKQWYGRVFLNPPGGLCDAEGRTVINAKAGRPSCRDSGACGLPPGHTHQGVTSSAKFWWNKLVQEYVSGRVEQAVFVGFSLEILQSTQVPYDNRAVLPLHFPCCYPSERVRFLQEQEGQLVEGDQPTHANVLVYLPHKWNADEKKRFEYLFSGIGQVVWPSRKYRRP